jgi:CRISPR/Cas system CSM-associated protein Csm2 small subunit
LKYQNPSNIYDVVLLVANKTDFSYTLYREPFYKMLDKIIDKELLSTDEKNEIINKYSEFHNILK